MTNRSRIGFIGLGHLGSRVARRLLDAGFPVTVFNRNQDKTKELAALGAQVAETPGKLAEAVDVVLSCVADDAAVKSVYFEPGGILRAARPGAVIVEMSTVAPETSRELYEAARKVGISALDVAISGSTPAAQAGTVTLLGGGDREVF